MFNPKVWDSANGRFTKHYSEEYGQLITWVNASIIDPAQGRWTDDQETRNAHIAIPRQAYHCEEDSETTCSGNLLISSGTVTCAKCGREVSIE